MPTRYVTMQHDVNAPLALQIESADAGFWSKLCRCLWCLPRLRGGAGPVAAPGLGEGTTLVVTDGALGGRCLWC